MATTSKAPDIMQDKNGKTSSKRIAGFIILSLGIVFILFLGIFSFSKMIADPETALNVGNTLMYVGSGLLGLGIFEGLKK